MTTHHLHIKNMVCPRCVSAVNDILQSQHIDGKVLSLGLVETTEALTAEQLTAFENALIDAGFELLHDRQSQQMEDVKTLLRKLVYEENARVDGSLSQYITARIPRDFNHLSRDFSEVYGQSVERYFISLKVERVKELMFYDELTLSEIAYKLNYSSVAHLSAQFKRETGLSPTAFKAGKYTHRGIL